jgi:hypothetical protein
LRLQPRPAWDGHHETAILSMWLAEHQMNVKFKALFGGNIPTLPLKPHGNIQCGNANELDWNDVCKKEGGAEIYVLGNPPYLGARTQNALQKRDVERVLGKLKGSNNLDYIACWFHKAADYIKNAKVKCAFVSTNSICQGEQVSLIWPYILYDLQLEIGFAHQSFKWENNAKDNAGVTVVIIALQNKESAKKALYSGNTVQRVDNISPYLIPGKDIVVYKAAKPLFNLPPMVFGSMANDGGHLYLNKDEVLRLSVENPQAEKFIRKVLGADEFIDGNESFCLWITDEDLEEASNIPTIARRISLVKAQRLKSSRDATKKLAASAHKFGEIRHKESNAILVPCHSSERREYIPMGFLEPDSVINNAAQAIYDAELWVFAIITSRLHNVWARVIGGALETRIRYSSGISYNPFPVPNLTDKDRETLTLHAVNVISEREKDSEKTHADLYDPNTMPSGLKQAHADLDAAVERIYRSRPFASDQQRVEFLLDEYAKVVNRRGELLNKVKA